MQRISKDMGITRADFFRLLPRAVGDFSYQELQDGARLSAGKKTIRITLGPQQIRQIAMIRIPHMDVELEFNGLQKAEVTTFVQRFDLAFRRGGG